jgi:PadR family transcriptional regulator AphA
MIAVSLRYALLGLLTREDATGYELTQNFKKTMIHFWYAHHSQIYRELSKMETERLVASKVVPQDDHPDKKVYKIKEAGHNELLSWLIGGDVHPPKLKDEQLLKISLFHLISKEESISYLQKSKEHHNQILARMVELKTSPEQDCSEDHIGGYLTLEFGIRAMKMWIEWCGWAVEVLESLKKE